MAEKRSDDRHKSGFMIRLPEAHREPLQTLKAQRRQSITTLVQLALEEYYQRNKVEFTPEPELPPPPDSPPAKRGKKS